MTGEEGSGVRGAAEDRRRARPTSGSLLPPVSAAEFHDIGPSPWRAKLLDSIGCHYNSLDYEMYDSSVFKSSAHQRSGTDNFIAAASKWLLCLLIGLCTALTAFAVNVGVENIAAVKFIWTHEWLPYNRTSAWFLYCVFDLVLVGASVTICTFIAPAARGSGIPDVKAYLNGVDVPEALSPKTLVGKVAAVMGSVASGLAVGKEGPFVHIGASIGAILARVAARLLKMFRGMYVFHGDWEIQDFVTCGATAGVAAAFRAPVGGVLFGLEELMSWWRTSVLWHAFFTTAVVSVTIRVGVKWCASGYCGWFGKNNGFIIFSMTDGQDGFEFYELLPMLLLGVIGGLLGSAFNSLNYLLAMWRADWLHKGPHSKQTKVLEAMVISIITSTVSFFLPYMFTCMNCPVVPLSSPESCPSTSPHLGNFVNFSCQRARQYNGMASLIFTTQDDAIRNLFSSNTKQEFTVGVLLTYFLVLYSLAIITYGIAVPSGLFVPCILCGATYGRLVGMLMTSTFPDSHMDEGTYALLGAASFLGGAMRSTVSICVMLLEVTAHLQLLPLIMLVLLVAKAVGDATGVKAIYELLVELKTYPVLPPNPDKFMRSMTSSDVCSRPVVTLNPIEKVRTLVTILQGNQHNGFPVVNQRDAADGGSSCGIILRHHLLILLKTKRSFQHSLKRVEDERLPAQYTATEFSKARVVSVGDINLDDFELEMYIDLMPYVSPVSYMVPEDASLSKVYSLFRMLGLRHLMVVPKTQICRGIITRKDLLPWLCEAQQARNAHEHSNKSANEGDEDDVSTTPKLLISTGALTGPTTAIRRNQRAVVEV